MPEANSAPLETILARDKLEILRLYDDALVEPERILNPTSQLEARYLHAEILDRLAEMKLEGKHVALITGAFDVPHDNHVWFARDARMKVARRLYGTEFEQASNNIKRAMIASDDIVVVLTLNADSKVNGRKSFQEDKGNIQRPVYTWETRANRMGGLMIPAGTNRYRPVIDLIAIDGDPMHAGTMFESHIEFGRTLTSYDLLDTWFIFGEHKDKIYDTVLAHCRGDDSKIEIIPEHEARYSIDPRTNAHWSSSSIIRHIQGEQQS